VVKQNRSPEQIIDIFGDRMLFQALNGYKKKDIACPSTWHKRLIDLTSKALIGTHGFPGALGFLHLNDCIRRYPDVVQSPLHLLCVEWAAVAIMMHDMKKIYWGERKPGKKLPENPFLRLEFDRDPLSSIVTLVDIIQEFERPAVGYEDLDGSVKLKYGSACSQTDFELNSQGILTLCYKMADISARTIKFKSLAKDNFEYFDNQYGYLDMSSVGINGVNLVVC
jgi:hypothetical protein